MRTHKSKLAFGFEKYTKKPTVKQSKLERGSILLWLGAQLQSVFIPAFLTRQVPSLQLLTATQFLLIEYQTQPKTDR